VTAVRDVLLSLVSSVIAGSAIWLAQRLLRFRRLARKRAFFGVSAGASCLLVSPRHFSSPQAASVHRRDMAALVEIATIVNDCGGRAEVVAGDSGPHGMGRLTEFCVGAPAANPRTAAHLRAVVPGVRFAAVDGQDGRTFRVGDTGYPAPSEQAEYVVLARAHPPAAPNPVFVIAGQTARSNLAAARLLALRYRSLLRTYGAGGRFCLVLRIVEPEAYGPDLVEIVADRTAVAFPDHPAPAARTVPGEPGDAPDPQPQRHHQET
jgi:hypothetical protein